MNPITRDSIASCPTCARTPEFTVWHIYDSKCDHRWVSQSHRVSSISYIYAIECSYRTEQVSLCLKLRVAPSARPQAAFLATLRQPNLKGGTLLRL